MIYLTQPSEGKVKEHMVSGLVGALMTVKDGLRPNVTSSCLWGADNRCYNLGPKFDLDEYLNWLGRFSDEQRANCRFATAPDVVGDWPATLERSRPVLPMIRALGFPAAICLQDGATPDTIPWDDIDCVFVGGTKTWGPRADQEWKLSAEAWACKDEATRRGKWTHLGRVNSRRRIVAAHAGGYDSADGSYLSYGPDTNLPAVLSWARHSRDQGTLLDFP